jgi:putative component of membrane protein insertase Oxa1/YidC/SpoIIIJ protein YidD
LTRRRRWVLIGAAGLLALAIADGVRPPGRQLATRLALAGIHGYQSHLREPGKRLGVRCRFTPSCSRYAEAVVARDGAWLGGLKAGWRILRCGPWTRAGTVDPP